MKAMVVRFNRRIARKVFEFRIRSNVRILSHYPGSAASHQYEYARQSLHRNLQPIMRWKVRMREKNRRSGWWRRWTAHFSTGVARNYGHPGLTHTQPI